MACWGFAILDLYRTLEICFADAEEKELGLGLRVPVKLFLGPLTAGFELMKRNLPAIYAFGGHSPRLQGR
jgi:hypothetical protein